MTLPELRRVPAPDSDERANWFATVENKLLEAEERYRALVETLPLATYTGDGAHDTGPSWVSPQIETITSYSPTEWMSNPELLGQVLHPDDKESVLAEMQRVQEGGGSRDLEYRMVRRDGSIVWVHDSGVIVTEGERRHSRGFIIDVTARREAELELERQNDQLRQLDSLKDEFVALVSHELRTPLTSIRGYLELISEDTNLTVEQTRFLTTIDRNAQRLQRVVGDLLFVAQVEAGKLSLEAGTVDINTVVNEAVHAAEPSAAAKSIELTVDLCELPEVPGDRARLAQVLDNFVSNAIKFTPTGGCVTVTTRILPGEIEIVVSDTGIGIPAHELPLLFQRFFRAERATSGAIPGTGLGLAIAKAIVTAHGGRICVESEDGAGSTFRVILPG
ncbi:MAG: multi-sensor signal transduction histidine kinase [Actinomycetia bacterium]|nr:multi-sensor signal transduction histidine kinase [Actinomycetes bacterium]